MEKELNDKLIAIQSNLKAPKNQYNSFGKYSYRSAEDVLESLKPLLKETGCSLVISDEIIMIGDRVYVKATATLSDGKNSISTSALAREETEKKGMDGAQITGAASSYARKYALNGLFCIDDTKDPDSTNQHGKDEQSIAKPIAKPVSKPQDTTKHDIEQAKKALEQCNDNASVDAVVKLFKNLWKDEEFKNLVAEARGRIK